MKKLMKLVSLLAIATVCVLLSDTNVMQVAAAPMTYYVKYAQYDADRDADWYMQTYQWDDDSRGRESYYLNNGPEKIHDGDILVVLPGSIEPGEELKVNVRLSKLIINRTTAAVNTKGVDECHVLGDSYAGISGDVTNAYVYDNAYCTFHNNVTSLHLQKVGDADLVCQVSVVGTVDYATIGTADKIQYEYFNFARDSFYYAAGDRLKTNPLYYSTSGSVPSASPAPAPAQTQTPAPAAAPAPAPAPAPAASPDSYDVVKKGDCLIRIARRNGLDLNTLVSLNPEIARQKYIYVGQKVRIK